MIQRSPPSAKCMACCSYAHNFYTIWQYMMINKCVHVYYISFIKCKTAVICKICRVFLLLKICDKSHHLFNLFLFILKLKLDILLSRKRNNFIYLTYSQNIDSNIKKLSCSEFYLKHQFLRKGGLELPERYTIYVGSDSAVIWYSLSNIGPGMKGNGLAHLSLTRTRYSERQRLPGFH